MNQIQNKTIFITGGTGFIGSTLAGKLMENNHIVLYDNLMRNSLKDRPFKDHSNITLIEGDVLDYEHLAKAMKGANIVVHCAAIAGIDTVIKSPTATMRVNMIGSANVLEATYRQSHIERVVCFSTSEVFGQQAFRSNETDKTVMGTVGEARWTWRKSILRLPIIRKRDCLPRSCAPSMAMDRGRWVKAQSVFLLSVLSKMNLLKSMGMERRSEHGVMWMI